MVTVLNVIGQMDQVKLESFRERDGDSERLDVGDDNDGPYTTLDSFSEEKHTDHKQRKSDSANAALLNSFESDEVLENSDVGDDSDSPYVSIDRFFRERQKEEETEYQR